MQKYRPKTRFLCCEPFGRSDADSVHTYPLDDSTALNYTFFFDQEPINLARHFDTFQQVKQLNIDLEGYPGYDILITSEKNSGEVERICEFYDWVSLYYFFHGWAALDWYRGYNRTWLMPEPSERTIARTFISPNRIVAGEREHRLIMLYYIFKYNLTNNWISCPRVCPAENIDILDAVDRLQDRYPDIKEVFARQSFPMEFPGETGSPMHSYQLSLFEESSECLLYLVTETVAAGQRLHLTEKTFKPICLRMPFIIVGTAGSLEYLRSYGFRTFSTIWDESYDLIADDELRLKKIGELLQELDSKTVEEKNQLFRQAQDIVEYNYNHFYSGAFEQILYQELIDVLESIPDEFNF